LSLDGVAEVAYPDATTPRDLVFVWKRGKESQRLLARRPRTGWLAEAKKRLPQSEMREWVRRVEKRCATQAIDGARKLPGVELPQPSIQVVEWIYRWAPLHRMARGRVVNRGAAHGGGWGLS
jgi:hypothetical protein